MKETIKIKSVQSGNPFKSVIQTKKDKIFQPFFTTKPTGQGTGLRLSLSYDIITEGHDGRLQVETEEGKGTQFIVRLPII